MNFRVLSPILVQARPVVSGTNRESFVGQIVHRSVGGQTVHLDYRQGQAPWQAANSGRLEVGALLKCPGRHRVSESLYLQVKPSGAASWLFRYTINSEVVRSKNGKQVRNGAHWMGLGKYKHLSIYDARQKAIDLGRELEKGIDPLAVERAKQTAEKLAAVKSMTFGECASKDVWPRTRRHGRMPSMPRNGMPCLRKPNGPHLLPRRSTICPSARSTLIWR